MFVTSHKIYPFEKEIFGTIQSVWKKCPQSYPGKRQILKAAYVVSE